MLALDQGECQPALRVAVAGHGRRGTTRFRVHWLAVSETEHGGGRASRQQGWDATRVRRLRRFLRDSQSGLAARLGTRQQTVSEWETASSRPGGMSRRLLHLLAEQHGFYGVEEHVDEDGAGDDADAGGR